MFPVTMWDYGERVYPMRSAEEAIQSSANFLISVLYSPDEKLGCVADADKVRRLVGDPGAVNFGDLRCIHVKFCDGVYIVDVTEADPHAEGLKNYLQKWLTKWGWPVRIELEW